jgi:MarR family transcriptional regulator, transcriptional regulator for hemolysin
MMEVERATAGRLIDRLEAKGWVERRAQAGDRRVNRIYLTPEAERVHKRIWHIAETTVEEALSGLSRREANQLLNLLARVKGSLLGALYGSTLSTKNGSTGMRGASHGRRVRLLDKVVEL